MKDLKEKKDGNGRKKVMVSMPKDLHEKAKKMAAARSLTLSAYLRTFVVEEIERQTSRR